MLQQKEGASSGCCDLYVLTQENKHEKIRKVS